MLWRVQEWCHGFDRSVGDDGTVGTARLRGSALTAAMHVSSVGISESMLVHLVSRTPSEHYGEGICLYGLLPFNGLFALPARASTVGLKRFHFGNSV
jgi:hypothetical protein